MNAEYATAPMNSKPREYEPGHMKDRAVPRRVLGNLRTRGERQVKEQIAGPQTAQKAQTSSVEGLADRSHADEFRLAHLFTRIHVRRRQDDARESHLLGLADAEIGLRDAAHFPAEADLAEHRRALRNRPIAQARRHRGDDAEIDGRLVDAHAAGNVHEHIVGDQVQAGALLEHGEQQRQAILIDADRHAPRHAVARWC